VVLIKLTLHVLLPTYHLPSSIKVTFGGAPTPVPAAKSNKELTLKSKNQQQKRLKKILLIQNLTN
jgi:hypothetical protein